MPYESSQWGVEKLRMTQRLDTARKITDTLSVLEEKVHSLYILLLYLILSENHTSCNVLYLPIDTFSFGIVS